MIDTAQGYGDSEQLVGRWAADREADVEVITKLRPDVDLTDAGAVVRAIGASREALGERLAGVLVHQPGVIRRWEGVAVSDSQLPVGVSIYEPDECERALSIAVAILQAPFNALDRRLEDLLAAASRTRIFLRSIYLQGLLVSDVPAPAGDPAPLLAWRALCAQQGISPAVAAIGWARAALPHAWLVIGAENVDQVADTIQAWRTAELDLDTLAAIRALPTADADLIDPRRWR